MKSLMSRLDSLIGGIVAVLMALALALSTLGILSRYFLADFNLDWIGEVVIFMIIWAILLCIPRVERRSAHVRVDFLFDAMSPKGQKFAEMLSIVIGVLVSILLVYAGWLVVGDAILWKDRTPSTLHVPLWIYYSSLSVAFALNLLFLTERAINVMQGQIAHPHDTNLAD